jgi:tRNA-specific 2-thiouridylase
MRLWSQDDPLAARYQRRCCPAEDIDDARAAADLLGIPHYVVNMEAEFGERVVDYFVDEYRRGRTPNPCLPCNEHVKFRALLERALALDAEVLATGHYARIEGEGGGYRLRRAVDGTKDQSYVLYMLGQAELARLRFPIGPLRKGDVRKIARELGLPNAEKPDSADICFLPTEDYRDFINQRVPQHEGDIVDGAGNVVGRHSGVAGFTVGQRKRLGLSLGAPRYVTAIDPALNVITVGSDDDLLADALTAGDLRWVAGGPPAAASDCEAQVRYRSASAAASVRIDDGGAEVRFLEPQRALTPGQAVVFYRGDEVLGGGIIDSAGDRATKAKNIG